MHKRPKKIGYPENYRTNIVQVIAVIAKYNEQNLFSILNASKNEYVIVMQVVLVFQTEFEY